MRAAGGEPRPKKRERRHRSRRARPCRLRPPSPTLPSLNGQLRDARMRALRRGGEQGWPGPPIVKASSHTVRRLSAERARRGEARCCGTRGAPPTARHRAGTRRWAEHVHFAAAPGTLCGWVVGAVRADWQTANILVVTSACTSRSSARSLYWILDDNIMASRGVNLRARLIDSYLQCWRRSVAAAGRKPGMTMGAGRRASTRRARRHQWRRRLRPPPPTQPSSEGERPASSAMLPGMPATSTSTNV